MKIAVLGSGFAGRTLAGGLADLGHDITIGTRDVEATLDRTDPDRMGNLAYADWASPARRCRSMAVAQRSERGWNRTKVTAPGDNTAPAERTTTMAEAHNCRCDRKSIRRHWAHVSCSSRQRCPGRAQA